MQRVQSVVSNMTTSWLRIREATEATVRGACISLPRRKLKPGHLRAQSTVASVEERPKCTTAPCSESNEQASIRPGHHPG